ncbi:MAG: N-6 DNA methylase [Acidobacteria bacterium]|nr:N-6 DNA methylase [Acidobacteriota bacterium]
MWVRERLVAADDRRRSGVHYTAGALADHVCSLTIDASQRPSAIWDPACGAGGFLLAAARRANPDEDRADVVEGLWGTDTDERSCDVARVVLALWAGSDVEANIGVGDALCELAPVCGGEKRVVVTNPPFLSPLSKTTRSSSDRESALRERFGHRRGAYTDEAALFALVALDWLGDGDRAGLVLPQSLLSNRDGATLRTAVEQTAALIHLWRDDGDVFDAAVSVCAVVLERGSLQENVDRSTGLPPVASTPRPRDPWPALLLDETTIPPVTLPSNANLGEVATCVAGFRDEYYALADLVHESDGAAGTATLVTSGAVDVLSSSAGHLPQRFAKRRWANPVVDTVALTGRASAGDRAARWHIDTLIPKVFVASQTKLVEAVVDPDGQALAVTPLMMAMPIDPSISVWMLAAALSSPPVAAHLRSTRAGSGMSRDAMRLSASSLRELPQPVDRGAWIAAGTLVEDLAQEPLEAAARVDLLRAFATRATDAYGIDDPLLVSWWLALAEANWMRSAELRARK